MDDRNLMENLLLLEKGACSLYLNGAIESGTANVNQTFDCALQDSLTMQDQIYTKMASRGWYQPEQAEQQKMQQVKQKFSMPAGQ